MTDTRSTNVPALDFEQPLRAWLRSLRPAAAQRVGVIDVIPLVHPSAVGSSDLLGHEALATGVLEVLEKDGGVVQQLLARNKGQRPIVLVEGETLVGARQNRIVAHTVVVGAGTDVVVPVGCMEHGRWDRTAAPFRSGASPSEWSLRQDIKASVMRARASGRPASLDQDALWARVEQELTTADVRSSTADYHALVEQRMEEVGQRVQAVRSVEGQVGVLATSGGRLVALDLVGSPETWRGAAARALASLVPAAGDADLRSRTTGAVERSPQEWLDAIGKAYFRRRDAIGLGDDFEIIGNGLIGSGVWLEGHPAHLSVFAPA